MNNQARRLVMLCAAQGRWKVNAIHLPVEVLHKLYFANAERLTFSRKVTVPVVDPVVEAARAVR